VSRVHQYLPGIDPEAVELFIQKVGLPFSERKWTLDELLETLDITEFGRDGRPSQHGTKCGNLSAAFEIAKASVWRHKAGQM
jgi:hypothetical protein